MYKKYKNNILVIMKKNHKKISSESNFKLKINQ